MKSECQREVEPADKNRLDQREKAGRGRVRGLRRGFSGKAKICFSFYKGVLYIA
jgi:hypothetical protein